MAGRDVSHYLSLLGVRRRPPDIALLRELHAAHLRVVPFENASVLAGERIALDDGALIDKLTRRRRGGFCYELNGAFAVLLRELGFEVAYLSARVYFDSGRGIGPAYDHLCLRVSMDEAWLADVGFGYSFLLPLRMRPGLEQVDPSGRFRLVEAQGEGWIDVEWLHPDGAWKGHYRFEEKPHELADFTSMCAFHSSSPDSHFTLDWSCARATGDGWVTLNGNRVVVSGAEGREERDLDPSQLETVLATEFGIAPVPKAPARDS